MSGGEQIVAMQQWKQSVSQVTGTKDGLCDAHVWRRQKGILDTRCVERANDTHVRMREKIYSRYRI